MRNIVGKNYFQLKKKQKMLMGIVAISNNIFSFSIPSQLTLFITHEPRPLWL